MLGNSGRTEGGGRERELHTQSPGVFRYRRFRMGAALTVIAGVLFFGITTSVCQISSTIFLDILCIDWEY